METTRLLKLADLLEADAANPQGVKFDLAAWAVNLNDSGNSYDNHFVQGQDEIPVDCGTAACAFGLAAISGAFADEGLTYMIDRSNNLYPQYKEATGFDAATKFFDIDMNTASALFEPANYDIRKGADAELEVAGRIRELVTNSNLNRFTDAMENDEY
jgi:hypothetical protein